MAVLGVEMGGGQKHVTASGAHTCYVGFGEGAETETEGVAGEHREKQSASDCDCAAVSSALTWTHV